MIENDKITTFKEIPYDDRDMKLHDKEIQVSVM